MQPSVPVPIHCTSEGEENALIMERDAKNKTPKPKKAAKKLRFKGPWGYCFAFSVFAGVIQLITLLLGLSLRYLLCLVREDWEFSLCWTQLTTIAA
jgi:hypothetical protein